MPGLDSNDSEALPKGKILNLKLFYLSRILIYFSYPDSLLSHWIFAFLYAEGIANFAATA